MDKRVNEQNQQIVGCDQYGGSLGTEVKYFLKLSSSYYL